MDVWTDLLCETDRSCPFEFCCAFVQGSLSCLPQSCWIEALLHLVWTRTSTKPTPGCLKRKMLPSASLKTHQRRTSKASLEASRASWGAPWFPRLSKQIHLLPEILSIKTAMHSFYCLFLFSPIFSFVGMGKARLSQSPYHQVPKKPYMTPQLHEMCTVQKALSPTQQTWTEQHLSRSFFITSVWGSRGKENWKGVPVHPSEAATHLVSGIIWPQISGAPKYHHVLSFISISVPYIFKAPFKQIIYNLKCFKNDQKKNVFLKMD